MFTELPSVVDMRPPNRIIPSIIIIAMMLSFVTGNVQATSTINTTPSMVVSIQSADYLDLDGDNSEDDIMTEFMVEVPDGSWQTGWTILYLLLELPSGLSFRCNILVIGSYSTLILILGWYNTAIEAGLYTFSVAAYMLGNNVPLPGFDNVMFDPPTPGDPGSPVIEILGIAAS